MEKSKEQKQSLCHIKTFSEFVDQHKNCFEKRKYFVINEKYEITKREPSFLLELGYIYFQTKDKTIENVVEEEFLYTYKEKNKRIDRLSKYEKDRLKESFRRSLVNKDSIHSVKLGNELLHRNKEEFLEIMYKTSLISSNCNKLIKTFFVEFLLDEVGDFNKNREQTDEIVRNIINYFVKSENEYINYSCENSIEYFVNNKTDLLYKKIYNENYDKIVKKYNIQSISKLELEINEKDYDKLSESKKILYNYLKNKK